MLRLIAAAARRDRPRWRVSGAAQPGMRAASSSARGAASAAPGLFGIPRLQRPEDFIVWSREAVERCGGRRGSSARPARRGTAGPLLCEARMRALTGLQ